MADNVAITAGSGTTIATEDEGGVHYQVVKLAASGNGTTAPLSRAEDAGHTDGDHGLLMLGVRNYAGASDDANYSALAVSADGQLLTESYANIIRVSVQSAGLTTATTAYTAGDQVGTQFTLANMARASGGFGYIVGVTLISAADIIGAYDVVFTRASITPAADNAAYAISDSDALNVVGIAQLSGAFDIGNNRIAQAVNLRMPYDCSGGTSLYATLITRSAHTFFGATGELQLVVYAELA